MIRKKDNGRWEARWTQSGRKRGRTFDRKGDAEDFLVDRMREKQLGKPLRLADVTLAALVEDYWRFHAVPNLAPSTRKSYKLTWANHIAPELGGLELRQITPKRVVRFRHELERQGVGGPTVIRALAVLQSILSFAQAEELLEGNPVAAIRKPKATVTRDAPPLPPATVEQIRRQLKKTRDKTLVSLMAYAGLRPQEALGLRWRDVGTDVLVVFAPKTQTQRQVTLLAPLAQDLKEWRIKLGRPHQSELVFPRTDGSIWAEHDLRNWRRRTFQPAAKDAGVDDCRPYDLRRSFVSLLIFEGHTIVEVAAQAGHSPETCARHYARVFAAYDPAKRQGAVTQIRKARSSRKRKAS